MRRWLVALALIPAFAQTPGTIEGVVADQTGAVIPGALADLGKTEAGPSIQSVSADEQGRFRFSAVQPGSYYARFRAPGFFIRRRGPLTITNGSHIDTGTVHLYLGLAQIGCCNCKDAPPVFDRKPASNATFAGRINAPRMDLNGEAVLRPTSGPALQIRIEDDGTFEFKNLTSGRYSLFITVPGYAPFEIPKIQILPRTAVRVDDWIILADCPSGGTCTPTRTVQRQGKSKRNAICL